MSKKEERSSTRGRNYLLSAITGAIIIAVVKWLWPSVIPFEAFELWGTRGSVLDWLASSWPAFVWGGGVTAVIAFATRNKRETNRNAEGILVGGTLISIWAGVAEEICFRWLIFLSSIVTVKIVNFLFFGFLGFGIPEFFFTYVFGPLADWTTLGGLHAQLFHPSGWAVGAAILAANSFFRDGHKYQGLLGWINSWFMGMFFFWLMFRYGLPAAILVHFLYDLLIFAVRYVDAAIERAQGHV